MAEASDAPSPLKDASAVQGLEKNVATNAANEDSGSDDLQLKNEVYNASAIDPVLAKKMALVNNAIDQIGMTPFQWKLFFFNGFGYAVDSVSLHDCLLC